MQDIPLDDLPFGIVITEEEDDPKKKQRGVDEDLDDMYGDQGEPFWHDEEGFDE